MDSIVPPLIAYAWILSEKLDLGAAMNLQNKHKTTLTERKSIRAVLFLFFKEVLFAGQIPRSFSPHKNFPNTGICNFRAALLSAPAEEEELL